MDPFEELLQQLNEPIALPQKPAAQEDTLLSGEADLFFDTTATIPQRLDALNKGIKSGAITPSPSVLTLAQKMQDASNTEEDSIRNSKTIAKSMRGLVGDLLKDGQYRYVSGELQETADDLFGVASSSIRKITSGGESGFAEKALSTLANKAFLENYEKLRGAGAISNAEGDRAVKAYSVLFPSEGKLNTGLSEPETKKQLEILDNLLSDAEDRLEKGYRWDETSQSAIPEAEWLERNRSGGTGTGALPTPEEAAKEAPKPEYTTIEKDTDAKGLPEGTKFYYQGKAYQKGPGLKIYILKE
jgi:hypothetical protein